MSRWQEVNSSVVKVFKEDANDFLMDLESSLLDLEKSPDDRELINKAFRALHTIKGSAAMLGFDEIETFAHKVETVFDLVRSGELKVTGELINLTLSARDVILSMIEALEGGTPVNKEEVKKIIESLGSRISDKQKIEKLETQTAQRSYIKEGASAKNITYRIRFRPSRDIFMRGTNPLLLLRSLSELGECKIVAQLEDIDDLEKINPELCYTYWDIILTTKSGINAIKDIFIFIEGESEVKLEVLDEEGILGSDASCKRLGEILVERGDLSSEDIRKVITEQKRLGEILVQKGMVDQGKIDSALVEQTHVRGIRKVQEAQEKAPSIRVASEKVDNLMGLVGELVTVQARLTESAISRNDPELVLISEIVERLTWELRDKTMEIRMVPIGGIFSRLKRLVRDLSNELGKEVEFTTFGAETELDKTLIEKLNDPLIHLIRNSVDHGIEPPEIRKAAGKPGKGTIHLTAAHSGPNVVLQISDDGAGIDPEVVKAKAIDKGLTSPESPLSEKDIYNLLFMPGFSTVENVTSVSGRGVGLDIVKKGIETFRGTIVIGSQKGEGTTVMLTLPLTLAIIEGLLVRIAGQLFIIPLHHVEECVELTRRDAEKTRNRNIIKVRDQLVPYVRLRDRFDMEEGSPAIEQIVIANVDDEKVGFVVDQVIGEHQTVIKSLNRFYRNVEDVSGATILGDGTVALILDIPQIIHSVKEV